MCVYMLGGIGAGGEGDDGGWDGWMASLTWWTWVWVNSGSWWWTRRPGVLWFMGSQRVGHDWATELNWYVTRQLDKWVIWNHEKSSFNWTLKGKKKKKQEHHWKSHHAAENTGASALCIYTEQISQWRIMRERKQKCWLGLSPQWTPELACWLC